MTTYQKYALVLLRVALGVLLLYAGLTKLLNPAWSAAGYLGSAETFAGFYAWLASPGMLPLVNFLNMWGLTLIGIALILGIFVRLASALGALMMFLYYLPILQFPHVGEHSYLVDEHIVYALALLLLGALRAGRVAGLEQWCAKLPVCSRYPRLRRLLG